MRCRHRRTVVHPAWAAALVVVAPLAVSRAQAETLGDGWQWRRPITVKQAASDAPGENVAWAEFYANGTQQGDGSDFRVTAANRYLVPSRVLQVSRDNDLVRIAFQTREDGPYYVWWGNPKAAMPAKELEIKRGFLLSVWRYAGPGGGGAAAVAAVDAVPAGPPMASYLLPEVNLGYNPYGDERQILLRYSGMFRIDRAITAKMAFTVNDMGTLWIDGKEVDRQIKQGLHGQVRQSVPVDLGAGWHTLEIHQVNQAGGNMAMALAWQRPGEQAFSEFPIAIMAPAAHGVAGSLEKVAPTGLTAVADISVEPTAEGFLPPGFYGQRYTFDATLPPNARGGGGALEWDFGDGQTSAVRRASHMFLGPGVYPVTVKTEGPAGASMTVRLAVKDRLYEKFPRPPEDPQASVRALLHEMKPDKLPTDQAFRGMSFFESVGDEDGQVAWGNAWLAGKDGGVADGVIFDETFDLARLELERKDFKQAAESFRLASGKAAAMETRANLMRHEVMTLCDYVDDADSAVKEAQDWLKKINTGNRAQVQTVQAAVAYALIARGGAGDGKAAKTAVDVAMAALSTGGGGVGPPVRGGGGGSGNAAADAYNQREIQQGVMTRNVENYIRTKDLDTAAQLLNQWELQFPDAIWEGFTRTLRVKLAAAEGRNLVAARIALEHARANPDGFYAAELLYRSAENFKLAGQQQQAKTVMDLLASKYPESPYAREAGK